MSNGQNSPASQKETNKPETESDIANAKNIHQAKSTENSSQNSPPKDDPSKTTPANNSKTDPAAGAAPRPKKTLCKKLRDLLCPQKSSKLDQPDSLDHSQSNRVEGTSRKQNEKQPLRKLIQEDLDYISRRADELGYYREQLCSIVKDASEELKGHNEVVEAEGLHQLCKYIMTLKLQAPLRYEYSVDLINYKNWRSKTKQSIFHQVPDMMLKSDVFETRMEFKDFEARYNELDDQLKLCLLCFSIFPPNTIIKKRLLVQWWVAEGFAFDHEPEHEHGADKCFNQLIDKGFIEPVNKNRSHSVGSCRMHPFNRSALVILAKRPKFFNFDDRGEPTQNFSKSYQACLMGKGLISYEDFKGGKLTAHDLEKLDLLKGKLAFDDLEKELKENNLTVDDLEKELKENNLTVDDLKKILLKKNKLMVLEKILKENKLTFVDLEKKLEECNWSVDLVKELKISYLTVDDLKKILLEKNKLIVLEKVLKETKLTFDDLEKKMKEYNWSIDLEKELTENKLEVDDLEKILLEKKLEENSSKKKKKPEEIKLTVVLEKILNENKLTFDGLEKKLKEYKLSVDLERKLKENKLTVDDLEKKLKENDPSVDLKKLHPVKGDKLTAHDLEKLDLLKGKLAFYDLEKELKENNLTVDDLKKILSEKKLEGNNKLIVLEKILKENEFTFDDLEKKRKEYNWSVDLEKELDENNLTVDDLEKILEENSSKKKKKLEENKLTFVLEKIREKNKLTFDDLEKKLKAYKLSVDLEKKLKANKLTVDDLEKKLKENDPSVNWKELHPRKGDKSTVDDLKNKLKGDYKLTVDDLEKLHLLINVDEHILEFKLDWFSRMTNLNFLHLGRWNVEGPDSIEVEDTKFLEGLKNTRYLKFLSLQGVSNVVDLPDSIFERTKDLNILDLRGCYNLDTIPETIKFLQNLTHLDMSECPLLDDMPKSLSSLKNLIVLKGFVVGIDIDEEKNCTLGDLATLENLIKLSIYTVSEEFPEERDVTALGKLDKLLKLTINWGGIALRKDKTDKQEAQGSSKSSICSGSRGRLQHKLENCLPMSTTSDCLKRTDKPTAKNNTPGKGKPEPEGSSKSSNGSGSTGGLPPSLKKLDLKCFPKSNTKSNTSNWVDWLAPNNQEHPKLEKLYITGGKLSDLGQYQDVDVDDFNLVQPVKKATRKATWKVKVLRLKYLSDIEMQWRQLRELFPDLVYLEKVNCPKLTLFPCDANGLWTKKIKS